MTPYQPKRTVLYVPASNQRALAKTGQLHVDAIIYDLEDSVAVPMKQSAREMLRQHLNDQVSNEHAPLRAVRINGLNTEWGQDDIKFAAQLNFDALYYRKQKPRSILLRPRLNLMIMMRRNIAISGQ